MKFLIQKINKEIRHDFSFTLIDVIRFRNWLTRSDSIKISYLDYDTENIPETGDIYPIPFKNKHKECVPIGSVEFVTEFLQHFYGLTPKPLNVPEELFYYAGREIFDGTESSLKGLHGNYFVKSNDKIKGFSEIIGCSPPNNQFPFVPPIGNYQISKYISIDSEWRALVYEGRLIALSNYCGDFTVFPNVERIKEMIQAYKSAPIAYTLDVGVCDTHTYADDIGTIVIECHDFFSCGLYGFNQPILANMFYKWFNEYLKINKK